MEDQKDVTPEQAKNWFRRNQTKLMVGGLVVLSLSNRSLRKENAKLIAQNTELIANNKAVYEILSRVKVIGNSAYENMFDYYFGKPAA